MLEERPNFEVRLVSDTDSDGESLFITQGPSQLQVRNNENIVHNRPVEGLDLENLLETSNDSAIESIKGIGKGESDGD